MTERNLNPSSTACGQWEMLLADALDGLLRPEDEARFSQHMTGCANCAALFEEARKGREWLEFLSPEPEVPCGLLDKILAQTGPGQVAGYGLMAGESNVVQMPTPQIVSVAAVAASHKVYEITPPVWQRAGFIPQLRRYAEPRLLMTAAMAFFSIALTLNVAGVRLDNLRLSALRPSMVRSVVERRLMTASTPVVRYYDHMRIRYEVEWRIRDLRRLTLDQGRESQRRQQQRKVAPGESKQVPITPQTNPAQQSSVPAYEDEQILESSLVNQQRPAHSGGSAQEIGERSTVWTA